MAARLAWRDWAGLGQDGLHDLLALRCAVFVVEQASPYLDVDGRDREAAHLLALEGERLVGALRLLPPGDDGAVWLGRIVVAPPARGAGLGRRLLAEGLARAAREHPRAPVRLGAQSRMRDWYAGFGFAPVGAEYDDAGIAHVDMARPADTADA